ncbi:MAG: type II secretion system F family protein, partial [Anaerolineae bacterium]|nr:type II secretion system F family protein [Anaerolineae bacterium]
MNSSKSSPKRAVKASFKPVAPFQLFYQLTYMSAMASAGITRSKTFELAAKSESPVAVYFEAINTLVTEMRFDYPEACRRVGQMAKSENMKSFLLRFSDALRSGEPLADFLGREAEAQGEDYQNRYERDLEGLKQWTNAFSSIVISVALIIIIQMISAMIYSMDVVTMTSMMVAGLMFSGLGTWIIFRSAPREVMTVSPRIGSAEQKRAFKLFRIIAPLSGMMALALAVLGLDMGIVLMGLAVALLPIGIAGFLSDRKTVRKDLEFSTFLRSTGGMASSSGTTLKQ